jgi:hypothetical protein
LPADRDRRALHGALADRGLLPRPQQHLGFGAAPARSRHAVERVTPFAAYVYSLPVLWARIALRRVDRVPAS